jgi:general secretion pathway protein G
VSSRHRRGFTLIELLVVITVLAVLASLVSPMVFRNVGDAKITSARTQLDLLGLALDTYRLDNDRYPSASDGLPALVTRPTASADARNWRGPYLKGAVPNDPWGRPYVYEASTPDTYVLTTLGRDGQRGGVGEDADITSADAEPR